jgi:hypothetical protein
VLCVCVCVCVDVRVLYGPLSLPLSLPLPRTTQHEAEDDTYLILLLLLAVAVAGAFALRASVYLDFCPFGSRKFACAGGVGDAGWVGGVSSGREERRESLAVRRNGGIKLRNEGRTAAAGRLKPCQKVCEVTFTQTLPYPSRSCHGGPGPSCPREGATA